MLGLIKDAVPFWVRMPGTWSLKIAFLRHVSGSEFEPRPINYLHADARSEDNFVCGCIRSTRSVHRGYWFIMQSAWYCIKCISLFPSLHLCNCILLVIP